MRGLPLYRLAWEHPPCQVWYVHASPNAGKLLVIKVQQGRAPGLKALREGLETAKLILEIIRLLYS